MGGWGEGGEGGGRRRRRGFFSSNATYRSFHVAQRSLFQTISSVSIRQGLHWSCIRSYLVNVSFCMVAGPRFLSFSPCVFSFFSFRIPLLRVLSFVSPCLSLRFLFRFPLQFLHQHMNSRSHRHRCGHYYEHEYEHEHPQALLFGREVFFGSGK